MPNDYGRFIDFPLDFVPAPEPVARQPRNPADYFTEDGRALRFTAEGTQQRAIRRGQSIEVAPPDTLQIDIDGPEAYTTFGEMLELYQSCTDTLPALGKIVERDSRTPGNKHITIELPTEYPVETRIMLQALLGSDLKRELLSLASHHNGHENPIVLYRPQEESNAASQQTEPGDGADRSTNLSDAGRPGDAFDRLHAVVRRRRRREYTPISADDLSAGADIYPF